MMNVHLVLLVCIMGTFERAGTLPKSGESNYHNLSEKLNTKLDCVHVVPHTLNSYDPRNNHTNNFKQRGHNFTMMSCRNGNHFLDAPPNNSKTTNLFKINSNNLTEQGKYLHPKETTTTEEPTTVSSENVTRFSTSHTRKLKTKENPTEGSTNDSSKNATEFSKTTNGSISQIAHDVVAVINNLTTVNTNFWGNGTKHILETITKSDSDTTNSSSINWSNLIYSCQKMKKMFHGKSRNSTDVTKKISNFIFYPCDIYDVLMTHLSKTTTTTEGPRTVTQQHQRYNRSLTGKPKIKKPTEITTISSKGDASNFTKIVNAGISHIAYDIASAINNLTLTYMNKIPARILKDSKFRGSRTVKKSMATLTDSEFDVFNSNATGLSNIVNTSVSHGKFLTNGSIKPTTGYVFYTMSPGEHKASMHDVRLPWRLEK